MVSLCFALAGCSSGGDSSSKQPAGETTLPVASASSPSGPASAQSQGASASQTPTPDGAEAFCAALLDDQKRAGEAIAAAILHPADKLTLADLQSARAKLHADWLLAPADLKSDVHAQLATMDDGIRRLRSGSIKGLDPKPFNDAQKRLQARCPSG